MHGTRPIDFIPDVLQALAGGVEKTQTQLTEEVWGTSGRNSPRLVNLLNHMVGRKLIVRREVGRAKLYRLPTV